jgi:hypothetical protein
VFLANLRLSFTDTASSVHVHPTVQLTEQAIIMAKFHADSDDPAPECWKLPEADII